MKHKKTCCYNPLHIKRLAQRFRGVNMSAAEQVFSWFRNYAKLLNEARVLRHVFKVLYFIKEHNAAIQAKKAFYLNKFRGPAKRSPKSYACSKSVKKSKAMKKK